MHIIFNALPYTSYQGIETFLKNIILNWPNNGKDQLTILVNKKSNKFLNCLPNHIIVKQINFVILHRLLIFIYQQLILPFYLKKMHADILLCPSLEAPWLYRRKIVVIHDAAPFVLNVENGMIAKIYWKINLFFSKILSLKIITVSKFSKKQLFEELNIDQSKIEVIYNASPFTNINKTSDKKKYFIYIGNARPRKNLINLINAYNLIKNQEYKLYIIGKMDEKMRCLKESNVNKNIIFFGFVNNEEKKLLLSQATCLLFPSKYEGFGIPILEAQSLNTPVLCSDIESFKEVGGSSVLYFNPEDVLDIKNKIELIIENTELRQTLTQKGSENITRFSWKKSSEKLQKIIYEIKNPPNK